MSDLLEAASAAMNVPAEIVERSAQARADASGASLDEVLTAWSGGGSVTTTAPPAEEPAEAPEETAEPDEEPGAAEEAEPAPTAEPEAAPVPAPVAAPAPEVVPEEELEPVALSERVKVGARIGALTGALLGLVGLIAASPWLLPLASVAASGEGEAATYSPAVEVAVTPTVVGTMLFSLVFGVIVAFLTTAATGWKSRSLALTSRPLVNFLVGALLGLALGAAAGGMLTGVFATPIENQEGFVTLNLVPTVFVLLVGGAILGAVVATVVELLGVPRAMPEEESEEMPVVRHRLATAFGIPLLALTILALLVLPMGWILIQSESLTAGGAAIIAIFVAGGVLAVGSLSTSLPNMRIGWREAMVGVAGLTTIVIIAFSVLDAQAPEQPEAEAGAEEEAGTEEGTGAATTAPATTPATTAN